MKKPQAGLFHIVKPTYRQSKADNVPRPDGFDLAAKIAHRTDRIARIAEAKIKIEERAAERFEGD